MSIKIYNGRKVPNVFSVKQLDELVRKMLPELTEAAGKCFEEMVQSRVPEGQTTMGYIWSLGRFGSVRGILDPKLELVFFPAEDGVLFLPYYGRMYEKYYLPVLEKHSNYWGYWNNADPEEDCSEEEWEQRKADWEEVLLDDRTGVPDEDGYSITVIPDLTVFATRWQFMQKDKQDPVAQAGNSPP